MRTRRLLQTSALALAFGAAIALGGCGTNQGESFMRGSDNTTQVQRPEELRRDSIPLNAGGSGGAGSGDPGSIQNGTPKPLGIPQPGTQPSSANEQRAAKSPQSDENVQGQGNEKPGVTSESLQVNQRQNPTHALPR